MKERKKTINGKRTAPLKGGGRGEGKERFPHSEKSPHRRRINWEREGLWRGMEQPVCGRQNRVGLMHLVCDALPVHSNLSCESPGIERAWVLKSGPWRLNSGRGYHLLWGDIRKGREWGAPQLENFAEESQATIDARCHCSMTHKGQDHHCKLLPHPPASASMDTHLSRFLPPQAKA